MSKMSKGLLLIFALAVIIVAIALAYKPLQPKPIVFLSVNRQHPVVRTMALGFFEACRDLKLTCKDYSTEGVDWNLFASAADQIVAQGSSGAVMFVDKIVYEQNNKLIRAGIPLATIHVQVDPNALPGLLAWVATDAGDYAKRAAVLLGDKLGGKGKILITQGDLNDVENDVTKVFKATLKEKYPNIVTVGPEMEGFDPVQAIAKVSAFLVSNPDAKAAFGTTGGSPSAWAKAASALGKKPGELLIVGMDYTRENLDLVKSDQVFALVGQPLYEETYRAVEVLNAKNTGKPVQFANLYPAPLILKADIDRYFGYADRVDKLLK